MLVSASMSINDAFPPTGNQEIRSGSLIPMGTPWAWAGTVQAGPSQTATVNRGTDSASILDTTERGSPRRTG
ncbi:hypothetical protein NITHO_650004 [Nitrolancea hollandica Lb]|uniref:Uncharacterized protein n=1 Tax=Nitrolancea hollandica Lb TaxID=1129897 RepID=I4EMT0_9BACT|nr:hypothetical protein NITHO_650004 [Nitrolancea hollandica Lb]